MKITIMGSSHGVPEQTRKCSSIMIETGGKRYIVDAGLMLTSELIHRKIDLKTIASVFITHMHGDHSNGLVEFCDLLSWYFKDVRPEIYVPEIKAWEAIRGWLNVAQGKDVADDMPGFKETKEGLFFDDGNVKVYAVDNDHLADRPSYSYMFEAEGKRVVLTGDMGLDHYSDFPKWALESDCDLVITEAAHCILTECEIFKSIRTKKLVITHIMPRNELPAVKLAEMVSYPTEVAYDGMEIDV